MRMVGEGFTYTTDPKIFVASLMAVRNIGDQLKIEHSPFLLNCSSCDKAFELAMKTCHMHNITLKEIA